jgi:hypothetical protein
LLLLNKVVDASFGKLKRRRKYLAYSSNLIQFYVATKYESWRPIIERALFEHLSPYAGPIAAGDLPQPSDLIPKLEAPSQVWPYMSLVFVSVTPLG